MPVISCDVNRDYYIKTEFGIKLNRVKIATDIMTLLSKSEMKIAEIASALGIRDAAASKVLIQMSRLQLVKFRLTSKNGKKIYRLAEDAVITDELKSYLDPKMTFKERVEEKSNTDLTDLLSAMVFTAKGKKCPSQKSRERKDVMVPSCRRSARYDGVGQMILESTELQSS